MFIPKHVSTIGTGFNTDYKFSQPLKTFVMLC